MRLDQATDALHESQRATDQVKSAYEHRRSTATPPKSQISAANVQKAVSDITAVQSIIDQMVITGREGHQEYSRPGDAYRRHQGALEPERFEDQYEAALKELLKKKQGRPKIEAPREGEPSKVVNLMDALRRSVESERGGERRKPARSARNHRAPKKAGPSSARAKKAS